VVVCPNPVLFKLPPSAIEEYKENSPNSTQSSTNPSSLPYRSIFAVLTLDSILIYDTFHGKPLSISRGYHCSGLTDCTWSSDGHTLVVSSNDGYISILRFAKGELGEVYSEPLSIPTPEIQLSSSTLEAPPQDCHPLSGNQSSTAIRPSNKLGANTGILASSSSTLLPPCERGSISSILAPPCKKSRVSTTLEEEDSLVSSVNIPRMMVSKSALEFLEEKVPSEPCMVKEEQPLTVANTIKKVVLENKENEDGFVGAVTKLSLAYPASSVVSEKDEFVATTSKKHLLESSSSIDDSTMKDTTTSCPTVPASKKAKKRIQPTHMMDA